MYIEADKQPFEMRPNSAMGDTESRGDLLVRESGSDQPQDLYLTGRDPNRLAPH